MRGERERERGRPLSREKGGGTGLRAKETKGTGKKVDVLGREASHFPRGGGRRIKRGEIRGRFSRLAAICPFLSSQHPRILAATLSGVFRPVRDTRLPVPALSARGRPTLPEINSDPHLSLTDDGSQRGKSSSGSNAIATMFPAPIAHPLNYFLQHRSERDNYQSSEREIACRRSIESPPSPHEYA